ncbi:MAG TPA: GDSL-type esterase/lipase family protein [Thermoanaerobaculia bacterium]|jgi:acyl-CoA thioesterase-1|nr:GDSL-type esterase/lipase family protein [Thermoanaerobaculia bacterium]
MRFPPAGSQPVRGARRRAAPVGGAGAVAGVAAAVALAAVAVVAGGCRRLPPNIDSPGTAIVCLGDSITAGVGASAGRGYPAVLAARLGREVIDDGVPGDTAEEGLARLPQVLAQDPWLVIVELGGNDILRQVPIEATEQALDGIVRGLLAARVVPVLVAVEGPFGGRHGEMYARLGKRYGVPVIQDALRKILFDPSLKADEVHPNDRGHARLAEAVAEVVEPLVREHRRRRGR